MIKLMPCATTAQDVSDLDPLRVEGRVMQHNIDGSPVIIGFGREPKYLASACQFYKLVPVSPKSFKDALPAHVDKAMIDLWAESEASNENSS